MNSITREQLDEMLAEFRIPPRIKRDLRFIPEDIANWQDRDFIAVTTRSGADGVLFVPFDTLRAVPFHLQKRAANSTGRVEAITCDFCATWQRGSNSAIISFQKQSSSVSFLCCADLLCSLHVRDKTAASVLSRTQLRENNTAEQRVRRLRQRLTERLP